MSQIYEPLMYQTDDLQIELGLAESYTVESDTEFLFKLRQGVQFHNGEELTAEDVKYTFERMREVNSPAAFLVDALEEVEVVDDYTFRMHLSFPFGPFITHLAHPATAIINRTAGEASGEDYGRNPVGTGPFQFVEWRSGDSITLERFEDYYQEPAPAREILFRFISEDTNRSIALETGEADIIYNVGPNDFGNLADLDPINAIQSEGLTTFYMGFNVEKEPFDDIRVRKAINLAVDVDTATEVAFRGYATPAQGPFAPNVQFANN